MSTSGFLLKPYHSLRDYARARDYYQQCLAIFQEIGNKAGQGAILCALGNTYSSLGEYACGLDCSEQSLAITKDIGDRYIETFALRSLAELHQKLGHRQLALEFCDQALAIATELGIALAKNCQELKEKLLKEEV